MTDIARIDTTIGDELFRDPQGSAAVSYDDLAALDDGGAAFLTNVTEYAATHPKLEVVFIRHSNTLTGDELIIRHRWRIA